MIKIHPKAAENFNSKSTDLVNRLSVGKIKVRSSSFKMDFHSKMTLTDEDMIGEISHSIKDGFGNKLGFHFKYQGQDIGIYKNDYKQLINLAHNIFRLKPIKNYCSSNSIEAALCEWIKQRYSNPQYPDFIDYLQEKINKLISNFEVWIPITYLCIQKPIKIGKVVFKPITKKLIDLWEKQFLQKNPSKEQYVKELILTKFRPFQGYTAGTMFIKAEPLRAEEIAFEEITRSLNILRIFTVAAFHPKIFSPFAIWGSDRIDQSKIILFEGDEFYSFKSKINEPAPSVEKLDEIIINEFYGAGLNIIDNLLNSDSISPFSQNVLDALIIYSRCTVTKDISDKLIYILTSLESIFLRNTSEPIQQNLSERIAFFIGDIAEKRKAIIKSVKNIYAIRSSFIHHGVTIENYKVMKEFMWYAWTTITCLISAIPRFQTKEAFLDAIDNRKLA